MKELFEKYSQNKNVLMFITSIIYILGLYSYFTNYSIIFSIILSSFLLFLLFKNLLSPKIILFWLVIFFLGYGNANFRIKSTDELFDYAPCDSTIIGQVVSIPNKTKSDSLRFFVEVSRLKTKNQEVNIAKNKVLVNLRQTNISPTNLEIGRSYSFGGKLSHPFVSTNPSQFSYAEYLRNFQVFTVFYGDDTQFHPIPKELTLKWKMIHKLNESRLGILDSHSKYLNSPNIEILGGVVFGDDAIAPPEEVKASFIHSGLLHILAASGMNVAFIYGFWYFILNKLRVSFRVSVISGMFVVVLYALMTGLGPSVIRASMMLLFILFGKLINRDANSISLLSFVALLMLLYNPSYINDVGFQLSFIVTFGLLLSANVVMKYTKFMPDWLAGAIFVPIIAQVWVIPIQMFYFNTISLYSVFANILSMPFLFVISCGGFISSVFALFKPISDYVCMVFDFCLNPMLNILVLVSDFFANLPHALYVTTHPNIVQVIIYYFILVLMIYLLNIGFKSKSVRIIVSVLSLVLLLSTINIPNKNFEVVVFDVKNADAFLLKTPQNKYHIIDSGNMGYLAYPSKAKIIMLKYMHDKGIKEIESLILTHFDSDHAGGAVDLLNDLDIKRVYVNSKTDKSNLAKEIYELGGNRVEEVASAKTIVSDGGFSISLNRANPQLFGNSHRDNESSVVALVQNGDFRMLFTGDAGSEGLRALKSFIPNDVDVLKVGHHGARGVVDEEIMRHINPDVSIISVGNNKYGHPNPMTLKSLDGTRVYRTDLDNAIKIVSNDKGYTVLTYDSNKRRFVKP